MTSARLNFLAIANLFRRPEPIEIIREVPGRTEIKEVGVNPFLRFEERTPSVQTAIDIFRDRWACDLQPLLGVTGTGEALLFTQDRRPQEAADRLGTNGTFSGYRILELGPLEGAHTFLLQQLGAKEIISVEASVEAYLKCLIVKDVLSIDRSKFLLGDVEGFLSDTTDQFDLIFCSGLLYHMADPLTLIQKACARTNRCFIWTHYYNKDRHPVPFEPKERTLDDLSITYWSHVYGDRSSQFWGGNKSGSSWLERDDIIAAFRHFGLSEIDVVSDNYDHPNGPAITFAAQRP